MTGDMSRTVCLNFPLPDSWSRCGFRLWMEEKMCHSGGMAWPHLAANSQRLPRWSALTSDGMTDQHFSPYGGAANVKRNTVRNAQGQWLPGNHHLREWCRDQFGRVLPNESRSHFGSGHEATRHARAPRSVRCCRRGHLMLPSRVHPNAGYEPAKGAEQKERRKPMPGLPPPGSVRIHR